MVKKLKLVIAIAMLLPCYSLFAEPQSEYGEIDALFDYQDRSQRTGHIKQEPTKPISDAYFDFKSDLEDNAGVNYLLEISPQYQTGVGESNGHSSNNETNLIVQWAAIEHDNAKRGNLLMWYQWSNTLGSDTTSDFASDLGVLSPPNGGDTSPSSHRDLFQHFAWEQWFADDSIRLMVGKLTTRVLFNLNSYTVSDREDFFTPMIVNNPVVHYTARVGFGTYVEFKQPTYYVSGMMRDADADLSKKFIDFDSINSGNWEYVSELGLTPQDVLGLGSGVYRLTLSYSDETDAFEKSNSISVSADQDVGEHYGLFFRYAFSDDTFRAFEQRLATGFQIKSPLNFDNDRIGLGGWWGKPTNDRLDDEVGVDLFWRLQLSSIIELTPGFQMIFNPALNQNKNQAALAQMRIRILL